MSAILLLVIGGLFLTMAAIIPFIKTSIDSRIGRKWRITVLVGCTVIAPIALGFGFNQFDEHGRQSRVKISQSGEDSTMVGGDYIEGNKIIVEGDYADLDEFRDLLTETEEHLEKNDQRILAAIEEIFSRLDEKKELSQETIEKKAEKKFEMVRNYNANFLLGKDYEERGGIATWFKPLWDGKNTRKFFLIDLVGRLDKDRISLFIDKDDLVYQVLTSEGRRETITIDISSWKKGRSQLIVAQWDTNKNWMRLFAGEKDLSSPPQVKKKTVEYLHFDELGPLVFQSIDFEGKYPAKLKPGSIPEVYSLEEQLKRGGWKEYK